MERRRVLAGLAVALAGCASTAENEPAGRNDTTPTNDDTTERGETTETTTTTPRTTEEPRWEPGPETPAEGFSAVSVSDATVGSDALSFSVETVGQATAERPARFRATLRNESAEAVEIGFTGSPGLSAYWTEGTDPVISFAPTDGDGASISPAGETGPNGLPAEPVDGCWRVEYVAIEEILVSHTLEAGASVSETYAVFGGEGCPPTGDYRVSGSWQVAGEEVEWRFTLTTA